MKKLFDMKCASCGACDERYCHYNDLKEQYCPVCGSILEKMLTAPAFSLQGDGYYKPSASQPKLEKTIGKEA